MSDQGSREIEGLAVLAVDDHEINRDFIHAALAPAVASLELACSGFEAIECCRKRRFDVVLMDLHMPDMDGLSAWEHIREQATGRSTRVIAFFGPAISCKRGDSRRPAGRLLADVFPC